MPALPRFGGEVMQCIQDWDLKVLLTFHPAIEDSLGLKMHLFAVFILSTVYSSPLILFWSIFFNLLPTMLDKI